MHSPSLQKFPIPSQELKHFPQWSKSCSVLTQTPSQSSSPGPVQSPPVLVPVPVPSVVPLVWLVEDESLPDELVVFEVVVVLEVVVVDVEVEVEVVGFDVDDAVVSEVDVGGTSFVLDIELVPADDALVDPLVVASVVSPSSPLQAKRVRPTSAASTTGADPWTEQSTAEQKGQRLSLSQT
ncbi:MAG: hypothetical protein H0T76_09000 [Nannocystis sp.]|nr:hypothetical protein [Nannocystis sp.]MBA3546606.1 hypothetical protein [Nannocystis sp.]